MGYRHSAAQRWPFAGRLRKLWSFGLYGGHTESVTLDSGEGGHLDSTVLAGLMAVAVGPELAKASTAVACTPSERSAAVPSTRR
jgi:hypothetical protein